METFGLIAEVKLKSPFGFKSIHSFDYLFSIAAAYGNWISIHTDIRWGGSFKLLKYAKSLTYKPILAKGIHATDKDIEQALKCGANAVLVVGRIPDKSLLPYCWLEPLSYNPLPLDRGRPIVFNQRNLKNGYKRKLPNLKFNKNYIVASYLETRHDIPNWANGWIVGENLSKFVGHLPNSY